MTAFRFCRVRQVWATFLLFRSLSLVPRGGGGGMLPSALFSGCRVFFFRGDKAVRAWIDHLHLAPRVIMSGAVLLVPLFSSWRGARLYRTCTRGRNEIMPLGGAYTVTEDFTERAVILQLTKKPPRKWPVDTFTKCVTGMCKRQLVNSCRGCVHIAIGFVVLAEALDTCCCGRRTPSGISPLGKPTSLIGCMRGSLNLERLCYHFLKTSGIRGWRVVLRAGICLRA